MFSALLATALVYAAGLDGPYLFDDAFNLMPVKLWTVGRLGWSEVVFGNVSGVLGRPVSMASFMLSAAIGGATPLDYKLGNLIIHLACGILAYLILRRVLPADGRSFAASALPASMLASLWLLHPLHVSTVLYAVQRMAQLSTLFTLLAILCYLHGRYRLVAGQKAQAHAWLFAAFPACWLLGLLSKENAAAAPALCLVLELAYFNRDASTRRSLTVFYAATLAFPALIAAVLIAIRPEVLFGGYKVLDFDVSDRLLSQARALCSYLGMLFYPRTGRMGVFTDDFPVSTGLLAPPTTALAIVFLVAMSALALKLRKRSPHLFAGWFFFLTAHAVESSVLPLQLYFEHRNYLPSIGLLLMIAGLVSLGSRPVATRRRPVWILLAACVACAAILGSLTWQQAIVWRSKETIVDQALRNRPHSLGALQAKMIGAINHGRYDEAFALISPVASSTDPRKRILAHFDMTSIRCLSDRAPDPSWLERARADARPRLTLAEVQVVSLLMRASRNGRCGGLSEQRIAAIVGSLADAATDQADDVAPKWQVRYAAAIIYARLDQWPQALIRLRQAWHPGAPTEVGALMVQALAHTGRRDEASRLLHDLETTASKRSKAERAVLQPARAALSRLQ